MDSHLADEKLKELHVESLTVKANDRSAAKYDIDPLAESKLLRKVDLRLIPILWFLFMLAFLDRTNIGNARILGMEDDLEMTGNEYNIALFIFVCCATLPRMLRRCGSGSGFAASLIFWGCSSCHTSCSKSRPTCSLSAWRLPLGFRS